MFSKLIANYLLTVTQIFTHDKQKKMRIRKYTYVDVHYNENEMKEAMRERKRLIRLGYELSCEDDGGATHYCDQYIKENKPIHKT